MPFISIFTLFSPYLDIHPKKNRSNGFNQKIHKELTNLAQCLACSHSSKNHQYPSDLDIELFFDFKCNFDTNIVELFLVYFPCNYIIMLTRIIESLIDTPKCVKYLHANRYYVLTSRRGL